MMATEKRLKGIPYKCDNCIHTPSCQRACSILAYPFLDYMIRSASCTAYEPKSDAVEVVHGRWVNPYINGYGHPCHCCSVCGFKASYQDKNYCPNCGAKMDGDGNGT